MENQSVSAGQGASANHCGKVRRKWAERKGTTGKKRATVDTAGTGSTGRGDFKGDACVFLNIGNREPPLQVPVHPYRTGPLTDSSHVLVAVPVSRDATIRCYDSAHIPH